MNDISTHITWTIDPKGTMLTAHCPLCAGKQTTRINPSDQFDMLPARAQTLIKIHFHHCPKRDSARFHFNSTAAGTTGRHYIIVSAYDPNQVFLLSQLDDGQSLTLLTKETAANVITELLGTAHQLKKAAAEREHAAAYLQALHGEIIK